MARDLLLRQTIHAQYEALMAAFVSENPSACKNFVSINQQKLQELLHVIVPRITKTNTWYRQSIDSGLKLAIILRHLATEDR